MSNINAKFLLRIDTYENWTKAPGMNKVLDRGEIGLCEIPAGSTEATTAPTVLFKVGDGTHKFHELNWASALAADVYSWAKLEGGQVFAKDGTGNVISGITYDATLNGGKGGFKYTTASVATSEGLEELQKDVAAIEKDITDSRAAWEKYEDTRYTFSTDGDKLVVKKALYTNGVAGTEETVGTYEFMTQTEVDARITDLVPAWAREEEITFYHEASSVNNDGEVITNIYWYGDQAGQGPATIGYTTGSFDVKGSADAVKTGVENGTIKAKNAEQADAATKATKDGNDNVIDTTYETKSDAEAKLAAAKKYTDDEVATALGEAKKYADDNDANTEYHVEYDSTNKKIKLVAGADASKMEIDATDFIKDGMINTVSFNADHDLVITFNTDSGKDDIVIPLDELIDIYTGVDGTTVKVEVSSDNKVSAEVKTGSLKDGHIASDAAIAKGKLAADVQTSLGKADTALQTHQDISHLATKEELNGLKNTEVKANTDAIALLNKTDGTVGSVKKTAEDAAAAAITAQGFKALAKKDTVGTTDIDDKAVTKAKLEQTVQDSLTAADKAVHVYDDGTMNIDEVIIAGPNGRDIAGSGIQLTTLQTAMANANSAVQPGDLGTMAKETATDYVKKSEAPGYGDILTKTAAATIAKTGSIYDANEANAVEGKDVKYFVFNGGSATSEW